jgi:hypothetical protein
MQKHVFMPEEDCNTFLALTDTPDYFDAAKLPNLSLFQIACWDEVHKEQVVGTAGTHTYAFPRDEHGAFDEGGMVAAQATKLNMKYIEKGRFCCGVASVQLNDGTEEGRRCYSYYYTVCNVVTITVHENMVKDEIRCVKI